MLWYTVTYFFNQINLELKPMPNEPLLYQLTQLSENYALRQKRANAVQAAFKLVANTQAKTLKALRDYAEHDTTVDVASAQEAFARVRVKEEAIDPLTPDLRREIKSLATLIGALKESSTALRSEPVDVVRLDKALTALQSSKESAIGAIIPDLQRELDLAQRALGDEFGQKLRAALAALGVTIGGRPPKFEIGRFELDANFAKRASVLRYGKDIVAPHVSITVDATVKAYQSAVKTIQGRTVDGAGWMAQFAPRPSARWNASGRSPAVASTSWTSTSKWCCCARAAPLRLSRANAPSATTAAPSSSTISMSSPSAGA